MTLTSDCSAQKGKERKGCGGRKASREATVAMRGAGRKGVATGLERSGPAQGLATGVRVHV